MLRAEPGASLSSGKPPHLEYGVRSIMQQLRRRRFGPKSWAAALVVAVVACGLAACNVRTNTQGNLVDPQLLKQVKPGALTKDQVQTLLGTPSSISTFDQSTWYYIGKQTQQIAFLDPNVLEQRVVAIDFDNKGMVTAIHQFGEADSKDVDIVARTTPTRGKSLGMFDQLWQAFVNQLGTDTGADATTRDPFLKR
jgi:outer membrane protein assembly factor BamE (lipoprotein component of BamABCDE complex)